MNRSRLICILLMMAAVLTATPAVSHINVRDGLSSRQVYEVEEDPDGFIWIFTNSGLDRFDGHSMKHYTLDPFIEQNDHIQSATTMGTASDGTLWIAVRSGAIYRYDREMDCFVKTFDFQNPAIALYNFTIVGDGRLAVATNAGLYRCDEADGIDRMALDGKFVSAVVPDGAGGFYAGTDHGVYRVAVSGSGYRSSFVKGTDGIYVRSLAFVRNRLFVGSFSSGLMVVEADGSHWRLPFDMPPMPVSAMTVYDDDSVLIGVDGAGVYMVSTDDGRLLHHYRDGDGSDDDLSGNTVTDVHVDRAKGIWIATSHNGLNYMTPVGHAVTTFRTHSGNYDSLVSDYVNVIYQDSEGDLWFGTDKGVSRFSPAQNRWWRYMQRADYVASVVMSITEDSRGRIVAGTYGDGVSLIDKNTGKVERLPTQAPGGSTGVGTDYIIAALGLADGNIWVGGINGQLTRYDVSDNSWHYYDEDCIAAIADSDDGPIFGGNKGVGTYSPETDSFTWTQTFDSVRINYPVRAVAPDTMSEVLWIGTQGDGLVRYDRRSGRAKRFTTADGLSSNTVYSLAIDNSGTLWICTETDIYRYDADDERLMKFTHILGTNRGVFNAGGAICTREGYVMLGTAEGCVVFNPSHDLGEVTDSDILLTDFRIHDREVVPGAKDSPLSVNINLTDAIELNYKQNSIEVDFALINYATPRRIGFEYCLEGYDNTAVDAAGITRIRYSDLPPGHYLLVIKAIDLYNGEYISERRLDITVCPAPWFSPLALALYAVLATAMLGFAVSAVRRMRRERNIESQLQSYAAIAHDIRTPMSMIKAPLLNVELESELSEGARANLQRARSGIDKTMVMLDELLGLRRESQRSRKLRVQPVDIGKYLQAKIEEYATMALFKGVAVECSVDDSLGEVWIDIDRFDHVADNLMSNAIKYTNRGKITLGARRKGRRHWTFFVADTGIGISAADARHVFKRRHRSREAAGCDALGTGLGLLITRRIVRSLKGSITFESRPDKGTTFLVTLPCGYHSRYHVAVADVPAAVSGYAEAGDAPNDNVASTIYIIEDDPDMRAYLRECLSPDYNIIDTDNSKSALEDIRAKNPDLVISDVMMPGLRGDELCHLLKTNIDTSHIPVILLTGLAGREDIVAGLEASADDYIIKPFDIVVLRARIRNIIKSRRELGRRVLAQEREPAHEDFGSELDRRFMTRVMEIIGERMADSEYSVNELCADLGMSRTSVYNKIKSISGQAPNEFIRIMRLNRAKELLSTHSYNISEVAYMVGFSDPKYFSTCFKKQFGFSPSKV